jgi:hypothetical protein
MCDPTHPVFRSGSILRAVPSLSASRAVEVGARLRDFHPELADRLMPLLLEQTDVSYCALADGSTIRVRLLPAVVVDFPSIEFVWRGNEMNFRTCFTACSGTRKAKIWTRYNFKMAQDRKKLVADFYHFVTRMDARVHSECLAFYNSQLTTLKSPSKLSSTYSVHIRMVSVKSAEIRDQLDRGFTRPLERDATRDRAYELLMNELDGDCGLDLPRKNLDEHTRLVTFRYPRKADSETIEDISAPMGELVESPSIVNENYEAICIVEYDNDKLNITGVAHELNPPNDFRRSAPHIVSGEISFEVGNSY